PEACQEYPAGSDELANRQLVEVRRSGFQSLKVLALAESHVRRYQALQAAPAQKGERRSRPGLCRCQILPSRIRKCQESPWAQRHWPRQFLAYSSVPPQCALPLNYEEQELNRSEGLALQRHHPRPRETPAHRQSARRHRKKWRWQRWHR